MPIVVVEKENNSLLRNGYDETDALPSNLRYNNFDLICSLISILTYLFDLIMDCVVAFYFYHLGVSHGNIKKKPFFSPYSLLIFLLRE